VSHSLPKWLAGGPLLRVAIVRRTTDTFILISYTTNVLVFKFSYNILIGVRIIKEIPGSVASGTHCSCLVSTKVVIMCCLRFEPVHSLISLQMAFAPISAFCQKLEQWICVCGSCHISVRFRRKYLVARFGQRIRNTWKVLKCGAGEGWRRSVGLNILY
jgi:hypothetical protein